MRPDAFEARLPVAVGDLPQQSTALRMLLGLGLGLAGALLVVSASIACALGKPH